MIEALDSELGRLLVETGLAPDFLTGDSTTTRDDNTML